MDDAAAVHESADVDATASLGEGTRVWHLVQIRAGASVGRECVVGRGAYVGPGVVIGDACKIQNYALLYEPATLGRGVFIGPGVILTNDEFPRAVTPDLRAKSTSDWTAVGVRIDDGASIGAGAVCVAPVHVGRWALVAAGAVVTRDVADFALVAGVPARRIGWVGKSGERLVAGPVAGSWLSPTTGEVFAEHADGSTLAPRSPD